MSIDGSPCQILKYITIQFHIYYKSKKIAPLLHSEGLQNMKNKMNCFENLISINKKFKMATKNIQPTKYSYQNKHLTKL